MSSRLFLMALILMSLPQVGSAANQCARIFSEVSPAIAIQKSIADLAKLKIDLDLAKVKGVTSIEHTALQANFVQKERELINLVEANHLFSRDQLLHKIKLEIQQIQSASKKDEAAKEDQLKTENSVRKKAIRQLQDLKIDGNKAVFHRMEPGPFEPPITKPFEMMATPMTQVIWRKVAELAEQAFPEKYEISPDPSYYKGDTRPVEQVSFYNAEIWIAALNELSQKGEKKLETLFPSHKKGDIYRLPTDAEWSFVVTGRGQYKDKYPFGDDPVLFGEYAWYNKNSNSQTQPVARKLPIIAGGKEFFDILGNVSEIVHEGDPSSIIPYGDPRFYQTSMVLNRGGTWMLDSSFAQSNFKSATKASNYNDHMGFRLVRVVP